jgi:hypothetical protein
MTMLAGILDLFCHNGLRELGGGPDSSGLDLRELDQKVALHLGGNERFPGTRQPR